MKAIPSTIAVVCNHASRRQSAAKLAHTLGVPLLINVEAAALSSPEYIVLINQDGVALMQTGPRAPGPVSVDFLSGAVDHRRKFGGGKGQMIAKAVGVQANVQPFVLDATAGLGRDAFVLATLGCKVALLERSALVYALLEDGLARAKRDATELALKQIISRMELYNFEAHDYLTRTDLLVKPDVIYLDPMFPMRQKSADVKKDMKLFHALVGKDDDADELLEKARKMATYRVVVKRPRKAPYLNAQKPNIEFSGKSSRFDVYTNKKMPSVLASHH